MIWTSSLLYLLTGLIGVWAAYDRGVAALRFAQIILGLLLAYTIARMSWRSKTRLLTPMSLACCYLAGALGAHFLLTYGLRIRLPTFATINQLAAVLTILIPLGAAGIVRTVHTQDQRKSRFALLSLAVALCGLGLTLSRGGVMGLGAGGLSAAYMYRRFDPKSGSQWKRLGDGLLISGAILFIGLFLLAVLCPTADQFVAKFADEGGSLVTRVRLWQDSLILFQDYRFTGGGLGSTAMVYSSYILLINAPFYYHAHNLFLQVVAEQGVPGLIAFVFILAVTGWQIISALAYNSSRFVQQYESPKAPKAGRGKGRSHKRSSYYRRVRLFGAAAAGSLIALVVHGFFDSEIYISGFLPLVFVPIGFAFSLPKRHSIFSRRKRHMGIGHIEKLCRLPAVVPVVVLSLLCTIPSPQAAFLANWGAVLQTRAEMRLYTQWRWPLQDFVRRDGLVDLDPAMDAYRAALAIDPQNITAHRRLGQIALSRGMFADAVQHLEAAHQQAPHDRTTRQLLGEAYAVTGDIEHAAQMWYPLDMRARSFRFRYEWYERIEAEQELEWIRQSKALSMNIKTDKVSAQ